MSSPEPSVTPEDGADALSSVLIEVLAADSAVAAAEARRTRALARAGHLALREMTGKRVSSRAGELAMREVASELAAATHLSDRTVQAQISRAMVLADHLPLTLDAWEAGRLSRVHVHVIMDAATTVPTERRAEFDLLAVATAEGLSPGRLRSRLATLAESVQPTTLTERHRAGRASRGVRVVPGENGMSDLIATLPTVLAVAVHDRLSQQAQAIIDARGEQPGTATAAAEPDERTIDHVRADVLADLLLTAAPDADPTRTDDGPGTLGAIRARVQVVVPALTMLRPERENANPAELVGHRPIDADTARRLAHATRVPWDRVITHPISGAVLHTDTYQRTAAIDRYLRARDRHCRWPGCTVPAIRCEIDHNHDWAQGGCTDVGNLCCFCQRHHTQKQFTRWKVRQLDGGVMEFTSPTGQVYTDSPHPYPPGVRFTEPSDESPPQPLPPPVGRAPF
ncbi:HNH endonuclease [Microbacterium enclense]|uniref:HNH endonuclease signature motif containing protein n=1 Tax=Microbacterium enclense TaxID=993073 RepID=UPI0021A88E66|nr:HNH endonuclease signature motif containing protein [Microbacterium enclense]MCT2084787.1 HNH endonuclease [Microbacterium enclense]